MVADAGIAATSTSSEEPVPSPSSIIDILSSDVQYSYFLRILQRNGMIPIINTLLNVTLLAPVNLAFAANKNPHDFDNANALSRYIVNQVFRVGYLSKDEIIFNTLYKNGSHSYSISIKPNLITKEYIIDNDAAIIESDIYAKHQRSYIQAIDHLLPPKPSICELLLKDNDATSFLIIQKLFILLFDASLTEKINSKKKKKNALLPESCDDFLKSVNTLLIPSDTLLKSSLSDTHLQYYLTLYSSIHNDNFSTSKQAIRDIRRDIVSLIKNFMIPDEVGGVNGTDHQKYKSVGDAIKFKLNWNYLSHELVMNDDFKATNSLVLADGIMHVFDTIKDDANFIKDLNVPIIALTPKNVLYAHHYSKFVRELKFRKLNHLIDGTTWNQTLFIDVNHKDDIQEEDEQPEDSKQLSIFGEDDTDSILDVDSILERELLLHEESDSNLTPFEPLSYVYGSSFSAKQSLLYLFIDESCDVDQITKEKPRFDRIYNTKLCSKSKIGSCFRLKISASFDAVHNRTVTTVNDDISVISEPIKAVNNNIVYIVKKEIDTPLSFKHSLGTLISNGVIQRHLEHIEIDKKSCLATLGYLNDYDLLLLDDNGKGYSVFFPCRDTVIQDKLEGMDEGSKDIAPVLSKKGLQGTWESLGLILNYLESHPKVFKEILKGLFLEGTIYSDFGLFDDANTTTISKSLRGDMINISEYYFDGGFNHYISLNETALSIPLNSDILFNQGVIHIIDKVILPDNFQVSLYDLIKTTEDNSFSKFTFLKLIEAYPKLKNVLGLDKKKGQNEYSLLIPTAESLNDFNITTNFEDLFNFLEFHLVPKTSLGPLIDCITQSNHSHRSESYVVKTNYSDTELRCYHDDSNGKNFLQYIKADTTAEISGYNKDHRVRVLSHGCTSLHHKYDEDLSCVFLIDKPLNLNWLKKDDDNTFLHIHLGFISIGIGIILGLILFGIVMLGVVLSLGQSKSNDNKSFPNGVLHDSTDSTFVRMGPSYMRVQGDDSVTSNLLDRGYETDDDDLLRNEREYLLPMHGRKRRGMPRYGATLGLPTRVLGSREPTAMPPSTPGNNQTAPRTIKNNVLSNLQRERNLLGGF